MLKKLQQRFRNKKIRNKLVPNLNKNSIVYENVVYCYYKKNNEMCAVTFLRACTLSRISSARVTFSIQNCFYSKLLEKKKFSRVPNLKKLYLEICITLKKKYDRIFSK